MMTISKWFRASIQSGAAAWAIALCGVSAPSGALAQTVEYIHTDALGTPVAVTDASRNVIERSEYEPYGALLNRPITDGPGYTGHVMDAQTGLTYMQQRYYDPQIGRFLSVDPVTASSVNGSNFNRYWYANNNPYKFTDPDGRISRCGVSCDDERRDKVGQPDGPAFQVGQAAKPKKDQGTVHRASTQSQGQGLGSYGPVHTPICHTSMSGCSAQSVYDNGLKVLPGPGGDGQPMQNGAISQLFVGPTKHLFDDRNLTVRNVALDGHVLSGVVTRQVVMDGNGWVYIQTSKVGPATPANVAARVFDASLWRDVDLRIQRLVHRQAGE